MSKLKELLRQQILIDNEINMDNFNVKNWPTENDEHLDLENYRFLSINDNELTMICGGDWQEGKLVIIGVIDDHLSVIRTKEIDEISDEENDLDIDLETLATILQNIQ